MADDKPHIDPLVGGLTRPPMLLGIPYVLFVIEVCLVSVVFINTKNLLMLLLAVPIHAISYVVTIRDARFMDIIMVRFTHCPFTRNRAFWGGDSYTP